MRRAASPSVARTATASWRHRACPPRYEHCSLANFDAWHASLAAALEKAMSVLRRAIPTSASGEGLGLLLTRHNGVGKTHLAVAVLRELVETQGRPRPVLGLPRADPRDQELLRSRRPATTELQVLEPVVEADVLLLDDLGAWKMTDWMNDTLFYILNSRYLADVRPSSRPTTSTPTVGRTRRIPTTASREFFVERIGDRLRSRLTEMCLQITIHGDDFRARQQTANQAIVLGTSQAPPDVPGPRPAATPKRPLFGG